MPTRNSKTYAARLRADEWEELERQMAGSTFSEWVRERLKGRRYDLSELEAYSREHSCDVQETIDRFSLMLLG